MHLTETIIIIAIITEEIFSFFVIHNSTLQMLNGNKIIVLIIINYDEFNAKVGKMNVFYLITNEMNDCINRNDFNCNKLLNTITYLFQTSIVSKVFLLNTVGDSKQTTTDILMVEFDSFAIVTISNDVIIVEIIIDQIVAKIFIDNSMIHILVGTMLQHSFVWINSIMVQSESKMGKIGVQLG